MFVISLCFISLVNVSITFFVAGKDLDNQIRLYLHQRIGQQDTPEELAKAIQDKFSFFIWSERTTILLIISHGLSWFILGLIFSRILNSPLRSLVLTFPIVVNLLTYNPHSEMYTNPLLFWGTLCIFVVLVFLGEYMGTKLSGTGVEDRN